MKWLGQYIQDLPSRFRDDVYLEGTSLYAGSDGTGTLAMIAGDLTMYNDVVDGDPRISIGSSATERLEIVTNYATSSKTMQQVFFKTHTASGIADYGLITFSVDEVHIADFRDAGLYLRENMGIQINGTDILTDSSGTATLSNIDAIDATTKATLESALTDSTTDSLVIDTDRSAAQGNAGAENITALHVDFDRTVPSSGTYAHNDIGIDLDVTSASLGVSTLYGMDIDVVGAENGTSVAYGIDLNVSGADTNVGMQIITDGTHLRLARDLNDYATFTVADTGDLTIATVGDGTRDSDLTLSADGQIKLEPVTGQNILLDGTIAIDAGVVTGATSITSTAFVGDVTGDLIGQAATVATIAGLAPNTATTQATQAAITTCANLATVGTITTGVWQGTAIAQAYIANDAINGDKIADDAIDSEHYTDGSIDTAHIADDQVTFAKAVGVTPNIYGSTIKILPSDFMANDDGGVTKTVQFVDENSSGLKPGNAGTELLAFVAVPEGMKVTLVDVYASSAFAVDVIALDIHQIVTDISAASIGTGNANTQINVTDTNSTATNFFMIQVTTTATSSRVYGALVTIAAQ